MEKKELKNKPLELKIGGLTPSKQALQSYLQNFTLEAIDGIVEMMRTSRNPQLKFASMKIIIDKSIPDIKAIELKGENGEPIKLTVLAGTGFIPALGKFVTTPEGSATTGSTSLQNPSVAPQGEKNNNGNNGDSKAGAS